MVELDQYKYNLSNLKKPLNELRDSLDLASKKLRVEELEKTMEDQHFWDDAKESAKVIKEVKGLKDTIETFSKLEGLYEDVETLIEMGYEEEDEAIVAEVKESFEQLEKQLDDMTVSTLLSDEYDKDNAILTIHAGAGGTESCDWASMLYRMYCRYADSKGFSYEVLDFLDGDEAGYKSVTIQISGENAYGYLKSERGVHRLVRISPFNAAGKRQTSFVSCDVMPDIDDDIDIEINDDDLKIDTYRAGGAGGQHVNKTSSAVRITHIPTGIVVQCQNERSQFQNKDRCMKMLKSQLYVKAQQENAEKISGIRGEVSDNGWGSQIRSYVMQPYTMVKDHRTNEEVGNIQSVLDGNIDPFINAYLKWIKLKND
ncbi:MAG: peptide chain release factor 2 [Lachnospiraceae bacterium]|nr:peptide chain release factor 2 [Lachnospiraceae bacterium]